MSSIFVGKTGLRHIYRELDYTKLAGKNTQALSVLLGRIGNAARMNFIDNATDADIYLLLVHPQADASVVTNRLHWVEIGKTRVLNYDVGSSPGIHFDPGTAVYAYITSPNPTVGKLRMSVWG